MTKTLLASFTLFLIPFLSFSQTQVSGNIQKNTTWTKANSPYILTGTVGVPSAYTLTIEPGVEVQRTEGTQQIIINGAVIVNGTKADSITFSSANFTTAIPFIDFEKSILDKSSIRFARFNNQDKSGWVWNLRVGWEIESNQTFPKNSGTLKISRSNLSDGFSDTHGYKAAKSLDIDSCIFKNANVSVGYSFSERINISNSTILSSKISSYNNFGILITNCKADNIKFDCSDTLSFMSSKVTNSTMSGSYAIIENSIFLNTPLSVSNLTMKKTKYIFNDKNRSIGYWRGNYAIKANNAKIQGCEFIGQNVSTCLSVADLSTPNIIISNNNFSGFENYIDVYYPSNISINNNNFDLLSQYAITNYSNQDIPATGNYFALKPGQTVDDIIYDNNDNLSYGLVNYTSNSATPVKTAPVSRPKNATKEVIDGNVVVRWNKNTETDLLSYKVCIGYVDPITYANTITVAPTDTVLVLSSASITDSIAVTASKVTSSGRGNEQVVYESWYSPAILRSLVLPVKLLSFNAVSLNNKTQLLWETANEVSNDHFDIEYSIDGINFTKIGTVPASLANSNRSSYTFIHNAPSIGVNYYRLKQVDKDGKFEYSNIVKVKSGSDRKRVAVYPSPATETINIVSTVAIVNAILINELGQPVKKINGGNSLQLKVNVSGLPKGVYRILIKNQKQEIDNISFIKQ